MEARAQARFVRVTPQKARCVVDMIRGKSADQAIAILRFAPQGASEPVLKVLNSAIANARYAAEQTAQPFDERTLLDDHGAGRNDDAEASEPGGEKELAKA